MVSRKTDMLKISHRKPGRKFRPIKGSKTMKKARHTRKTRTKTKSPGYLVKGNRVHYRTKTGKTGSMPKGHVGMIRRWGLKKITKL